MDRLRLATAQGLGACGLLALAALTCAAPPAPPPRPAPTAAPAPSLSTSAPPGEAPSAAPASSAAPGAAPATPPALGPRAGAAGSTRGTIACGETRCRAGAEACVVVEGAWRCAPAEGASGTAFACDDGSDCPSGKTCCFDFASDSVYAGCAERAGAGCAEELCEADGARCPAGLACVAHRCVTRTPTVGCGSAGRCAGATPVCRFGADGARCVSEEEGAALSSKLYEDDTFGLFACTRPSDCGPGRQCCSGGGVGTRFGACATQCDVANTRVYCATAADCRGFARFACPGDRCRVVCAPLEPLSAARAPAGVRVCDVAE